MWRRMWRALRMVFLAMRASLLAFLLVVSIGMVIGGFALAMSKTLFDLASSAASRLTSQTVRASHTAALQSVQNELNASKKQLVIRDAQVAALRRQTASARAFQAEFQAIARELADRNGHIAALRSLIQTLRAAQNVTYQGQKMAPAAAVALTARDASDGMASVARRSIASMAGKALPFVGTAVIVSATAWQLNSMCEINKQLRELDVAFNPDNPIGENEVCGRSVPTSAELWATIRESPGYVWDSVRAEFPDMPQVELPQMMSGLMSWGEWLMCSIVRSEECGT